MGLDISFNNTVVSVDLTHNLTTMAEHIPCSNGLTLYDVLWRGNDYNILTSDDIGEHLLTALKYMSDNKDNLLQFTPSNGCGSFDGLYNAVKKLATYSTITDLYIEYSV